MNTSSQTLGITAIFATGALVGYTASLMLPNTQRNKQKSMLLKAKNKVWKGDLDTVTKSVFGKSTAVMRADISDTLENFKKKYQSIKSSVSSMDTEKYEKVVKDFSNKLQQDGKFTRQQISALENYLRTDYKALQSATS